MKKTILNFTALFALFFLSVLTLEARLYLHADGKTFNVRVANQWFKEIDQARGRVTISGAQARLDIEAAGYRTGHSYVYLQNNVTNYYCDVRLDETSVWIKLENEKGQPVANALVNNFSQSMYWGDEYGFRIDFPRAGFQDLTENKIRVLVNYLYAGLPRLYLAQGPDRWSLEVVLRRRDMQNTFSNHINVVVPSDAPATPPPAPVPPQTPTPVPGPAPEPAPPAFILADLVNEYRGNQLLAEGLKDPTEIEVVHHRLESLSRRIRGAFTGLAEEEQQNLLLAFPKNSPLERELQTLFQFQLNDTLKK